MAYQMPMENHCGQPMERVDNYLRCVICRNTNCWGDLPGLTGRARHYCFRHQKQMHVSLDYPEMRKGREWDPDAGYTWGCFECQAERYVGCSVGVAISFPDEGSCKKKWWQFWK